MNLFQLLKKYYTYNFCNFATFPEGLNSKGVESSLHGNGVHLHYSVFLTEHTQSLPLGGVKKNVYTCVKLY